MEKFPEALKDPKPVFINKSPVINKQKPTEPSNYSSLTKISTKVNEIPPITPEKFFSLPENSFNERNFSLTNINQKSNQIEISQHLTSIPNESERITKKEQVLLDKIKNLEEQLKQTQTERNNLKIDKEKAEAIAKQEKQRADNYQQQLKTIAETFQQWQKISYYQQLEKERKENNNSPFEEKKELEAKIEQSLPFKPKN